jgi:hypothetical protein
MCNKYNGWSNYETWVINLWLDSEHYVQQYWQEIARDDLSAGRLADILKEEHEEFSPTRGSSDVYSDLLQAALDSANWQEIADHIVDAAKEEAQAWEKEA